MRAMAFVQQQKDWGRSSFGASLSIQAVEVSSFMISDIIRVFDFESLDILCNLSLAFFPENSFWYSIDSHGRLFVSHSKRNHDYDAHGLFEWIGGDRHPLEWCALSELQQFEIVSNLRTVMENREVFIGLCGNPVSSYTFDINDQIVECFALLGLSSISIK